MSKGTFIGAYRIGFALLGLAAIVAQLIRLHDRGTLNVANFFSFFTIQSNLLAIAILLYGGLRLLAFREWPRRDFLRGAIVLYLSLTGIVYGLLLAGYQEALQTTIPWVDTVLHRIIPLVMVVDWVIDPPKRSFTFREASRWLIYPVIYLVYTLIRGPIVDWYPYPFLNPDENGGYAGVIATCLAITAGVLVAVKLLVWLSGRRPDPVAASGTT